MCLNLGCRENLIGVEVSKAGSVVVGAAGRGSSKRAKTGVVIARRNVRGRKLEPHQWADVADQAADVVVALAERCHDALGTTCARELAGRRLTQAQVGRILGFTRQAVRVIERRALRFVRARLKAGGIDGPQGDAVSVVSNLRARTGARGGW